MAFMVALTLELHDAKPADDEEITKLLSAIGLSRAARGDSGDVVRLPHNTFFSIAQGPAAPAIVEEVMQRTMRVLEARHVHGNMFVAAAGNAVWRASLF